MTTDPASSTPAWNSAQFGTSAARSAETGVQSRPRLSVVMPCFNAGPYLDESVGCVMAQTLADLELIVVDDGSTDDSVERLEQLVRRYPGRLQLLKQDRKGPYPARNLALRHAKGELVAFLDADDYWRTDFLARMDDALSAAAADIAYCGWQNVGQGAPGTEPYLPPVYEQGDPVEYFLRNCPWPIHAAVVRREVLDAVGGFSERRFSSMDYDLWLRVLGHTQRMIRVPEVMAFYRWHGGGQVSSVKWRQVLDAEEAQRGFVRDHPERVSHLSPARLSELIEGRVLQQAFKAVWSRDLASAQRLFRHASLASTLRGGALVHVMAAWLPQRLYLAGFRLLDRLSAAGGFKP